MENWEDSLQDGTLIISTSLEQIHYSKKNRLQEEQRVDVNYIWGVCTVFFYRLVPSEVE